MTKLTKKTARTVTTKPGFTIIEVSLVTAFMAMLMIAIATVTTSISAMYRKGITLKAVNSVGRNLVTELTTSINAAPSIDSASLCNSLIPSTNTIAQQKCIDDGAYKYVYQSWEGTTRDQATGVEGPIQYGGVLCTGNYSYIWNTFYGRKFGQTLRLTYKDTASGPDKHQQDFKIIRFVDKTYLACSVNVNNNYDVIGSRNIDVTHLRNGVTNVIDGFQDNYLEISDITLDLYELTLFPVSQDSVTLRAFFSGTFILATERGEVNIVRGGDYCNVDQPLYDPTDPDAGTATNLLDLGSEFNYCGINKFNFAARTAGSGI